MSGAWDELVRRHSSAVNGVAKVSRRFRAKRSAARAFDTLLSTISAGPSTAAAESGAGDSSDAASDSESDASATPDGPADRVDPAGVVAVRPRVLAILNDSTYGPGAEIDASVEDLTLPATADPEVHLADLASVARAFATLPEPWQTALWHRVVEQQTAAEYAPLLGRAANDAAAVVQRADAGLFEAYLLDQRAHSDVDASCAPIIPLLGGGLRSTLSAHEQRLVDDHLGLDDASDPNSSGDNPTGDTASGDSTAGCAACARRVAVSRELAGLLPAAIVPELAGMSVERYREAAGVRPAAATVAPDERRRRIAFVAIWAALLLAAGAAVLIARDSLRVSDDAADTSQPASDSTTPGAGTTDPGGSSTPTTTELQLRPPATGPINAVSIDFDEAQALGFAPVQSDLSVVLSSPGPVFAGGTGTIDVTVTNSGTTDETTAATLRVPDGVVFDALVDGPAACVDPDDDSARCDVTVAAGATERVTVRFRLQARNVGQFVVSSNLAADDIALPITAIHRLVHSSVDEGQIIVAGNTLMTCVESDPNCVDARNGVGDVLNRWDLPAEFVGGDLGPGWFNSSSATVDLEGGDVEAAYLFWSGDLNERNVMIPDDGRSSRVVIVPPGAAEATPLEAERVRLGDVDATQYFGTVDITDIVREHGTGSYTVGNVQSVEVQGSYAGWSMVVVTRDDALPRRSNAIMSPFAWFSPDDTFAVEIDVPFSGPQSAKLDVVAFEGERAFTPEQLTVGGNEIGDAAFDSTIVGERDPSYDNNFGIDVDSYDLTIDASTGTLPIVATSDKDGIRLAVLSLAVDVE